MNPLILRRALWNYVLRVLYCGKVLLFLKLFYVQGLAPARFFYFHLILKRNHKDLLKYETVICVFYTLKN